MYSSPVPQAIRSASTCGLTATSLRPLAWLSLSARRSFIAVLLASNRSAIFSLHLFGYLRSISESCISCLHYLKRKGLGSLETPTFLLLPGVSPKRGTKPSSHPCDQSSSQTKNQSSHSGIKTQRQSSTSTLFPQGVPRHQVGARAGAAITISGATAAPTASITLMRLIATLP